MFTIKAIKQYRVSSRLVNSPDSYLPKPKHTIKINGMVYKEISRFPTFDVDFVSRFWVILPGLIALDILFTPFWIYRLTREGKFG